MNKWFILSQGQISGPFNEDQISLEAAKNLDSLVWARGEAEWVPIDKWDYVQSQHEQKKQAMNRIPNQSFKEKLDDPIQNSFSPDSLSSMPKPPPPPPQFLQSEATQISAKTKVKTNQNFNLKPELEKTSSHTLTQIFPESEWRLRIDGEEFSELSYSDLLEKTKNLTDFTKVKIYDRKTKQWRDIYGFEKIINDLGISRRKHDRVPILGTFVGECDRLGPIQGRVVSVSEGGFGLSEGKKYQINDQMKGVISSPNLIVQINCSAEVVYLSPEGVAGMKFKSITEEAHSSLIEYIKKFNSVRSKKKS